VTVVEIENGTILSSHYRSVIKVSLQQLHCPNPEIWLAPCVDIIQHNLTIKEYVNCTVLLRKHISCLQYKINIKMNAVPPHHSVGFRFVPSKATSSTSRLRNAVGTLQLSSFNYVRIKRTIPLQLPYTLLQP